MVLTLGSDEGVVGGVRQGHLVLTDDLDDRGQSVLLDALVEAVNDLVALDARTAGVVHLRDGGGDGVGDVAPGAGGRLVGHLLVHTGEGVLGVDVDVVVPLGGVLRVGHRQGDDEVLGRDDLVRGPGLADEVGADFGLISAEVSQAVAASGDRVGGAPVRARALETSPLVSASVFHPALVVRSTFSLVMVNSTSETGLHSAVGSSLPVPSVTPLVSVCSHLWMVSDVLLP